MELGVDIALLDLGVNGDVDSFGTHDGRFLRVHSGQYRSLACGECRSRPLPMSSSADCSRISIEAVAARNGEED